jgi:Mg-chelatase subunit ChlD
MDEKLTKWRMILGQKSDPQQSVPMTGELKNMDATLEALYDSERQSGLGSSSPNVNRWLGDIRKYFPSSVVQIMQKDALERLNLQEMLFEPELLETIEPDVSLVGTLISLKSVIPQKTKETARMVVQKVVDELQKRLHNPMREAVAGALSRSVRNYRPKFNEINWHATIRRNLKHYQKEYKTIIPHQLIGYGRKGQALKEVILVVDQSGSMASSVVYASVFGAVMASLKSLKTHMIVFDTAVVDLTKDLDDPVDILFGTQLGGGTDINKALGYAQTLIKSPNDTILILISDLYEGGNQNEMLKKVHHIQSSGVQFITLLSLSDEGAPTYDKNIASSFAAMDIPSFACTPDQFPLLMAAAINKEDIGKWTERQGIIKR